jgi:release factor glutamine methyltransferase
MYETNILCTDIVYVTLEFQFCIYLQGISAAWAGGTDGRLVIDRFIPQIFPLLAENGSCFLVLVKENKPEELKRLLIEKYDLQLHYVIEKRARNEHLIVVKIVRHS